MDGRALLLRGAYHRFDEVRLNVRPVQQPRPPVWVATLRTDAGARVGARGLPAMFIPYASAETWSRWPPACGDCRAAFTAAGAARRTPPRPRLSRLLRGDDGGSARGGAALHGALRAHRLYAVQRPFETLVEQDVVAIGDPDEVLRVARRYEAAGFTHFLAIANFGGLPHKRVLRSMELMARHILPRLGP